jgi:ATP-dependent DNA helicase RecQ
MANEFDLAISYALERVGCPSLTLKPEQRASIKAVYDGKDVFLWLPTGFGKSICYTTLPFVFDFKLGRVDGDSHSVVLVVSPLISLMVDQVANLRAAGVSASVVSSGGGVPKALVASEDDLAKCSVLFCAPEALVGSKWRDALEKSTIYDRIVAVVVDEVHCVSKR